MTNKFRRSMTSVLLAASLLFSSQSVVAFADYGSKSDASDLSPVQESVENTTEEQQEDPSLSVEPVIGESTEAPVAAPMMARANAPVAYSAPSVDTERYEWLDMSFTSNCNSYSIDLYTTKNAGTIHEENQNVGGDFDFTEGIGFRTYKAVPNNPNEWVFDSWKTNVYFDGWGLYKPIEDDNIQGPANKWAFSMRGYDTSKYDGSDADVQLNAILPTAGIVIGHPLYYTLCANFNPLVTVTTDGNGTVTAELTQHEDKYEVEYGNSATFTITPKDGYEVDTVKVNGSPVEFTEVSGGNYTLPFVTEPTTLEVTFDKTEEQPFWTFNADENGSVKWNNGKRQKSIVFTKSEVENLKGNDGIEDFIYAVPDENYGFAGWTGTDWQGNDELCLENLNPDNSYNSTAHFNPLVNITFNPGDHGTLVNSSESTGTITSGYDMAYLAFPEVTPEKGYRLVGWKRDGSSEIETISVKTPVAYVENGITYTAQYEEVPAEQIEHIEINLGDNLRKEIPFAPIYLHAEYDGDYIFLTGTNKHFTTPPVSSIPDTLTTDVDDPTKAQEFFSGFTCLGWNFAFDKHYISNAYISEARVEGTTLYMTLDIPAPEAPANINELLDVTLNCENPDHPVEYGKSKTYSDLLLNSYTIGEVKNNDGTYTCDITINPSLYLADFYKVNGGIDHSLVTRDPETGSVTVPLYYDFQNKQWKLVNGEDSPVTFLVSCTTQKPIDNPEWKDISALFNNYVTVDCTTNGHDPRYYSLTEGEVEIGEVYSAVPIVGEDSTTYFVPITFKTPDSIKARVISDYDSNTPNDHILWSGFIPASITLRYDNENKVWVNEDVKNVLFTVTCTTGGGTIDPNPNPGGGGDNDDDDDRYTGDNTVTRTINDDDVPLNDRPTNTTTIDDEDVPLADLPDDTVTIDDGEVPLKANPSTGDSLPFAAMAAAAQSLGGVIVLNRKKK